MSKRNTKNEAEGAEFLVLAQLLIRGKLAYKAYTNMPGYDLVAFNDKNNIALKIQVKSRWSSKANSFLISNTDCDFIVLVKLNWDEKEITLDVNKPNDPEYYIFPKDLIISIQNKEGWGKVEFKKIPNMEDYKNKWSYIIDMLN